MYIVCRHVLPDHILYNSDSPDIVDTITVPEFHGNSYLKVPMTKNVGRFFAYEIWFLSTRFDGRFRVKLSSLNALEA